MRLQTRLDIERDCWNQTFGAYYAKQDELKRIREEREERRMLELRQWLDELQAARTAAGAKWTTVHVDEIPLQEEGLYPMEPTDLDDIEF